MKKTNPRVDTQSSCTGTLKTGRGPRGNIKKKHRKLDDSPLGEIGPKHQKLKPYES